MFNSQRKPCFPHARQKYIFLYSNSRCLKFLKKRIGNHVRAKRKREEMQGVIQAMRKHNK